MPEITRRDFLKLTTTGLLAASGLIGLGGIFRFLSHATEPAPQTEFELGPASNYPVGSRTVISEVPAMLIHTESGFSGLSLVCTHLGCTVESKDGGFACPCHGSLYAKDGSLLRGPATQRLALLPIEITSDEKLILHTK
jgi:cytochrome b6-f complex iron-sulfur subunit